MAISQGRLLRRGRALEATLCDTLQPIERSFIAAAPEPALPVMLREPESERDLGRRRINGHAGVKMTAQRFVLEGERGTSLVDSPYIELVGANPGVHGHAVVWDTLTVSVGAEVLVCAAAAEDADAPSWFTGTRASSGYRDRKIRRLIGTEKNPIQLLVLSPP